MLSNPGKALTMYTAVDIIGKYFSKAFAKNIIEKGIYVTGIYALNGNIFDENEFLHPMLLTQFTVR